MHDTRPILHDKAAFQEALRDYTISDHGKEVLAKTPFVALSGIAGGGRNTVIRELVKTDVYMFAVSDTTRPPKLRDGRLEQNGVDYYFRQEQELLDDIRSGEFIEAEIIHDQQVSGTSIREIERVMKTEKIPIHDFEYGGINAVARVKPDAVIIGLLPPSYEEWLRRFQSREVIHKQEFRNRLVTAKAVLENMLTRPDLKIVLNDDITQCVGYIRGIVERQDYPADVEQRASDVARDILAKVKNELDSASTGTLVE